MTTTWNDMRSQAMERGLLPAPEPATTTIVVDPAEIERDLIEELYETKELTEPPVERVRHSAAAYREQAERYQETLDRNVRLHQQYVDDGNRKHADRLTRTIERYTRLVEDYRAMAEEAEEQG